MKLLRWDLYLTVKLASWESISHLYPAPYHYQIIVTVKACSRNITGSTDLPYRKKVNLEVLVRFPFQGHPLLLGKEKSAKRTYFAARRCLINPSLIFETQSLIIHSILSFALVCLTKVCDYSVLPNVMKNLLLIARVILQRWFLLSPYS